MNLKRVNPKPHYCQIIRAPNKKRGCTSEELKCPVQQLIRDNVDALPKRSTCLAQLFFEQLISGSVGVSYFPYPKNYTTLLHLRVDDRFSNHWSSRTDEERIHGR